MTSTSEPDLKALLHNRLKLERVTLWRKAQDLPEWQQRMPLTPSGTSLLGLVKHVALTESEYFGDIWGDPTPGLPEYVVNWDDHPELEGDDDCWAFADETPEAIFVMAASIAEHTDALITEHRLGETVTVPWWGGPGSGGREATLGELLMHMLDETARHLGHADIVRELTDGAIGMSEGNSNIPEDRPQAQWRERLAKLTAVAEATKPHHTDEVR